MKVFTPLQRILTVPLIVALLLCGCAGNGLAPYARTAVRVLKKAKPIYEANGLSTEKLDKAIKIGEPLAAAFESGATNVVDQVSAFITAFDEIASDAELIKDQSKRTVVLVVLAVADEALHELADSLIKAGSLPQFAHLVQDAKTKEKAEVIRSFAKKPRYRARDARTGKFVSLDYARQHPDTTVIERVKDKKIERAKNKE